VRPGDAASSLIRKGARTLLHLLTEIFRRTVRDHMGPVPAQVARTATVVDALNRMARASSSAVIVTDSLGRPAGIMTEQEIVRRVAWRASPDQSIETIMTTPVVSVSADDNLFYAILAMRRHRLRYIPVVDRAGVLAGLLELHQVLLSLSGLLPLMDPLAQHEGIDGLKRAKESQVGLARTLLQEGVSISHVQSLLTEINCELHRHALTQAISEMAAAGWGEPPVTFALIVMGSVGRCESLLAPDQDNGFILADYADVEHSRIDAYFVPLAERFTDQLNAIGFPRCLGNVMATNPVWRKRISEWRKQIVVWLRQRTETQLLLSDILVDFRHVWGDAKLSEALRTDITHAIAENPTFVMDLFAIEADHTAALGWFGKLRSERDKYDRPEMINLKLRGSLPLVEAARLLSLKAGTSATSTLNRLDDLLAKGALHSDDHDQLKDAFQFISRLLLRQQIEDFEARREVGDFVPEARLSKHEKEHLVGCLRTIVNQRTILQADLAART
jgi:CBS domain-containing protein